MNHIYQKRNASSVSSFLGNSFSVVFEALFWPSRWLDEDPPATGVDDNCASRQLTKSAIEDIDELNPFDSDCDALPKNCDVVCVTFWAKLSPGSANVA